LGGAGVGFDLPILAEADDAELSSGREVAEARASIWRWKRVEAKEAAGEAPKPNEPSRAFPPLLEAPRPGCHSHSIFSPSSLLVLPAPPSSAAATQLACTLLLHTCRIGVLPSARSQLQRQARPAQTRPFCTRPTPSSSARCIRTIPHA
jgi:hypothetical protein